MRLFASGMAMVLLAGPLCFVGAADDLSDTFAQLKEAQSKNDPVQVKKLAADLHALACEELEAKAPEGADEKEAWTKRIEYVKSTDLFTEYALFATAVQQQPPVLIDLMQTLEQQNPKSKYLDEGYGTYLAALAKSGSTAKVLPVAEKALVNFPENEDLLLLMVDNAMNKKQADRALSLANRLVASLVKHKKPESLSQADWDRKRNLALAHGYWTAGVIYGEKGQFMQSDKSLRSALPLIRDNPPMLGPALFYLGVANYQLGKMTLSKQRVLEGATFCEQSAAIESPYAEQARHNALVMKQEGARMR